MDTINTEHLSTNEQNMIDTIKDAHHHKVITDETLQSALWWAEEINRVRPMFTGSGRGKTDLRHAMDQLGRIHHATRLLKDAIII